MTTRPDQPAPNPAPGPAPSATQLAAPQAMPPAQVTAPAQPAPWHGTSPPPPSIGGTLFAGLWPERDSTPQLRSLLGSLAVGALAALLAFERRLGVIAFVVLLLGGLLVWRASADRTSRLVLISAAVATALGFATFWRAVEWLAVVSVLLGGVVAAMAVTRATKVSGIIAAVASWPLSGIRGLPLLGRTITATSRKGALWPVLRTAAISLVALVLFGGLFASADAIFGSWANAIIPDLRWDTIIARTFILVMVGGVTLAGCYLALNPPKVDQVVGPAKKRVRLWEWAVPVGFVIAMFAGFLLAQANATLRGHEYVRAQAGMSYADYVHQGFAQLTFATILMLVVVALTLRKASTESATDRLWLRLLLGTLSVLTLAVVASALWRMHLYQQTYGFTSLRLFVDGFELWLGVLVVLVLVALVRLSTRWLGRAAVFAAAAMLLGLAALNPDAWVAGHNIDRFATSGRLDAAYLHSLSDDAVPTIAQSALPTDLKSCILHVAPYDYETSPGTTRSDDWLEFNLGRARAERARASVPAPTSPDVCAPFYQGDVRWDRTR
ncbi:MAG TPA: DUF4173 domain-containing protein [Intrasporangiaceae bacterium]|nr:DUF4173 domain-containing protein [Intrasporangiaceae bacterium]